ncbi:aminotransferase class V-fold PLP-dependent enzyme [Clostridium transplantifaecale]|uniref:aminotransferase class V-fold PLP-dependent enzyme n=1 Tax=Clostridium transplantifaecale TaxID=2479838 RepID=UPI000F63BD64|nr:aminotransferase class V-fold PLP-dependent enzyme [Clostridium transplantifaecale]
MNIDFEKIRKEEWPVLETMTFLDAACVSFAPQRTVKAVKAFAEMTATQEEANSSAHHIAMDSLRHKAYEEAAKLLNADPEEIALVESTSHGLNIAAQGIELQDGDNIITTNLEFIQVALPWCVMRKDKNIDIRVCKTDDNRFTAKDFAALADEKTKLIVMSTLEWCNGWQTDLKELGEFCKEKGIFLVVDAVQQLGVTKIDTKECHVDILTAGGHKWLNSPYGTGVLYVNKEALPKIKQSYAGYLNTTVPEGGWGAYWENPAAPSVNAWTFDETARKFEIGGTSNYTGAIALGESLALVNEIGIENIEKRIREIATYCMDRIEEIGGTLITHRDPGHFGGIVIARLYDDLDVDRMILKKLHAQKIFIAQRFTDYIGGFRISCQYFNNEKDIDTMIAAMKEIIKEIGREPDYKK